MTLSADAAPVPEDRRLAVYALLLQYNNCWSQTDGVRMPLAEPGGPVVSTIGRRRTDWCSPLDDSEVVAKAAVAERLDPMFTGLIRA